jgi:kynurenine formamidase
VRFFPGLKEADLPGGEGCAIERLTLTTHNGTHLDAPYHFHSTLNGGKRAWTIDEVPLEWCFGRGVVSTSRQTRWLRLHGGDVRARTGPTRVSCVPMTSFCQHRCWRRYGEPDYVARGCGIGREATLYLTERGVRVTGTDAWSWDAPFVHNRAPLRRDW